ncbi:DUF1774-domain-containing protein [Pseudovirgaria hyperparasitica]|uniref:DUF1774-domain-containing protein n=1 Tax=Pseudovirgaria hyperparasitica TaxID=470096 RepID=A0A6A6WM00_9PEZI|nr:DUF1774-domain-containing protein [Pseudovirgaria hyperparasitica]KAF2763193.1 DUF1774-domain-containing protein [Pseudovirgaria hyperparasitica]
MPSQISNNETIESAHQAVHSINPFKSGDSSREAVLTYKIGTALSWLLLLITSVYYTFARPHDGGNGRKDRHTIWGQNDLHPTAFALNSVIVSIYWIVLYILQIGYSWHLYSGNSVYVTAAATVGSHFILNNLFLFAFIMLWVRSYFWIAELILALNFINLSTAYFNHSKTPRWIHIAVVSAPLAWNFVALYWAGAAAINPNGHSLVARIVANIFVWGILTYGAFFLAAYKDYTMGFELSILAAALGVGQFLTKTIAFQWIFAFVIMSVLFVLSLAVGIPGLLGQDPIKRGQIVSEDRERAPLLADD